MDLELVFQIPLSFIGLGLVLGVVWVILFSAVRSK